MVSQPKSAVNKQAAKLFQQHWRYLKGDCEPQFCLWKADRLLEQKRTGSQYDKNEQLKLLSQRKLALTGRNI
jgi:hypothetical protein